MSNPYLAILATPPGRERFGDDNSARNAAGLAVLATVPGGAPIAMLLGFSAVTAALLNAYYAGVAGEEITAEEAAEMIIQGQNGVELPGDTARGALKQKAFNAAVSMAGAITKSSYMLGALSRQLKDRRFADVGARVLRDLDKDTSSKISERNPEKIVVFYDQLMRNTIAPMLAPYEKRGGITPETKYILSLIGQQGARDRVKSAQAREEEAKAKPFEMVDPTANQDTCFPGGKDEREAHTKLFAKIPSFLQEPDPKASGCKNRLKPWVMPTGIGVGVGLVALLLFRRRRPQQTVVMIPSSSSSPVPTPTPANR